MELRDEIDRVIGDFESRAVNEISRRGWDAEGSYWSAEDDPTIGDFRNHVGSGTSNVWRPFSTSVRNDMHYDALIGLAADVIQELTDETLEV